MESAHLNRRRDGLSHWLLIRVFAWVQSQHPVTPTIILQRPNWQLFSLDLFLDSSVLVVLSIYHICVSKYMRLRPTQIYHVNNDNCNIVVMTYTPKIDWFDALWRENKLTEAFKMVARMPSHKWQHLFISASGAQWECNLKLYSSKQYEYRLQQSVSYFGHFYFKLHCLLVIMRRGAWWLICCLLLHQPNPTAPLQ